MKRRGTLKNVEMRRDMHSLGPKKMRLAISLSPRSGLRLVAFVQPCPPASLFPTCARARRIPCAATQFWRLFRRETKEPLLARSKASALHVRTLVMHGRLVVHANDATVANAIFVARLPHLKVLEVKGEAVLDVEEARAALSEFGSDVLARMRRSSSEPSSPPPTIACFASPTTHLAFRGLATSPCSEEPRRAGKLGSRIPSISCREGCSSLLTLSDKELSALRHACARVPRRR